MLGSLLNNKHEVSPLHDEVVEMTVMGHLQMNKIPSIRTLFAEPVPRSSNLEKSQVSFF